MASHKKQCCCGSSETFPWNRGNLFSPPAITCHDDVAELPPEVTALPPNVVVVCIGVTVPELDLDVIDVTTPTPRLLGYSRVLTHLTL